MAHPEVTIIEGPYRLTREWWVTLPEPFHRRFEGGDLVIWRAGLTIWITIWNNALDQSARERLEGIRRECSPEAFDPEVVERDGILLHAFRLLEEREAGARVQAFYGFAIGAGGHVEMAAYADAEEGVEQAKGIWQTLEQR